MIDVSGLVIAWLSSDMMVGVVAPLSTVTITGMISRTGWPFSKTDDKPDRRPGVILLILGSAAIIALGAYYATVYHTRQDIPLITGGLMPKANYKWSFDFALGQLARRFPIRRCF